MLKYHERIIEIFRNRPDFEFAPPPKTKSLAAGKSIISYNAFKNIFNRSKLFHGLIALNLYQIRKSFGVSQSKIHSTVSGRKISLYII